MTGDAFTSGFIIVTALLVAVTAELCALARRRARRRRRPNIEPVPWRAMERFRR